MEQRESYRPHFRKNLYVGLLPQFGNVLGCMLKSDKNITSFTSVRTYVYDILPWLVFVIFSTLREVRAEAEETVLDLNITAEQIRFKSPRLWFVDDHEI
jgi:hypothetical protein